MQQPSKIRVHAAEPFIEFWGRMMSRKRKLNDDAEFSIRIVWNQSARKWFNGVATRGSAAESFAK
jgi:hypothetical protein